MSYVGKTEVNDSLWQFVLLNDALLMTEYHEKVDSWVFIKPLISHILSCIVIFPVNENLTLGELSGSEMLD